MMEQGNISGAHSGRSSKRSFLLMAFLVIMVTAVAIQANLWKEDCRVEHITVEGNRNVPTKDILALAKVPENTKLFELDLYTIEQRVMKHAYVKSVAVLRDIPDRVRITIEERVPVAAMVADKLYYLDEEGYVLPQIRSQHIFDLPVLSGSLGEGTILTGKKSTNKSTLDALYVLSVARQIDEELYLNISEINVKNNGDFVFYTSEFGIPVVLGRTQVGTRLVKFDGFWKSVVASQGAHELLYIDLRFEDQVVVRWNHDNGDAHS